MLTLGRSRLLDFFAQYKHTYLRIYLHSYTVHFLLSFANNLSGIWMLYLFCGSSECTA